MKLFKFSLMTIATASLLFFGYACSQAATQFNFESSTEGWVISNDTMSAGITSVARSSGTPTAYNLTWDLKLNCTLDASNSAKKYGETLVMAPGSLNGTTITIYVYCPTGSQGTGTGGNNGYRTVLKDSKWRSKYGTWYEIGGSTGYYIPLNTWTATTMSVSSDANFDATDVITIGASVATAGDSTRTYTGPIYIDYILYDYNTVSVPLSDYKYDFTGMTAQLQYDKPFDSHRPYWDTDPFWYGLAFSSSNVTIETADGSTALAISTADFKGTGYSDSERKGCIQAQFLPNIDIANKDNKKIQFRVKFQNYVDPFTMVATIVAYDRRAGPVTYWFNSDTKPVGGNKTWNIITFDCADPTQHDPDRATAPATTEYKQLLRVGLQLYANKTYTGKIWLDNITVGGQEVKANWTNANANYITTSGKQFMDGSKPFLFSGTNNYYLFYKTHFMIDALLDDLQTKGIKVIRTWAFCDGKGEYCVDSTPTIADGDEGVAFQPTLGTYDNLSFQNLDYVIAAAGKRGMRLILPLVNFWSDKDKEAEASRENAFGGVAKYLEWRNITLTYSNGMINNKNVFYTSSTIRTDFKNYINYVVNRTNSYNGLAYKNDKTILAWELANEPEDEQDNGCTNNEMYDWAKDISDYIVSVDTNHLVGIGDTGWLNESGTGDWATNGYKGVDWKKNLGLSNLKFACVHIYPDWWSRSLNWVSEWIVKHTKMAQNAGKPIIFSEFGRRAKANYDRDDVYTNWTDTILKSRANGDNVWMIIGKQDDDTYYPDYDQFNFNIYSTSTINIITTHQDNIEDYGLSYDSSTYSFEDGTTQNFTYATGSGEAGITAVANSTTTVFAGGKSLKCTMTSLSSSNYGLVYRTPDSTVGPGDILMAHVYLPANGATTLSLEVFIKDNGWTWFSGDYVNLSTGTWNTAYLVVPGNANTSLQQAGIKIYNSSGTGTSGDIYFDSFQVITGISDNANYNFENGTTQGWSGTNLSTTTYAFAGHHALQTTAANYGSNVTPSTSVVGGWCITARVYVPGGAPSGLKAQIYIKDNSWTWKNSADTTLYAGDWVTLKYAVPKGTSTPLQELGIKVMNSDSSNYTSGSVYLDNIWVQNSGDNTRFSFEDATSMDWNGSVVPGGTKMAATAFVNAGRYAVLCRDDNAYTYVENPSVYPGASTTLTGKVYTHYVSWGTTIYAQLYVQDNNWTYTGGTSTKLTEKEWTSISVTVPADVSSPIKRIGVKFMDGDYNDRNGDNIYIDSIDW